MSRTGNLYDNAMVESFWGKLKTEMVYNKHFRTRAAARAAVFDSIEAFYSRTRLHAALEYLRLKRSRLVSLVNESVSTETGSAHR